MNKSPIDELFYELFGFYPNKAGQAYELLVMAAIKAVTEQRVNYNQHQKGLYSNTDYQIDGELYTDSERAMIEAKDYTINKGKVGRGDLQKMQGALTDLDFNKGIFASATDYTKPAQKYSSASEKNPSQKPIELYHIRPSTEHDEKGRVKKITLELVMIIPDFDKGRYLCIWTKEAWDKFERNGFIGKQMKMTIDRFYKKSGEVDCFLVDFSRDNQPIQVNMADEFGVGCWLLPGKYIKVDGELYELKGMDYKIPYSRDTYTFTIEAEGTPRVLIQSGNGSIDKLLTDEELRKLIFDNGKVK